MLSADIPTSQMLSADIPPSHVAAMIRDANPNNQPTVEYKKFIANVKDKFKM